MCGIVAFSAKTDYNEDKIKTLLLFNQDRGKDSFGYYVPNKEVSKTLGKIEDIAGTKDFKLPGSNLFIGHIRAATVGKVEIKNSHPFIHGNIVLAMNGTLTNHWSLCTEYGFSMQDFDVDSDVLTACLNKDQTKDIFSKILGGCAVVYTDSNTDKLYCYRNADRPLYRGTINGDMYISSIDKSLKFIGCDNVKEFKQDNLYEIKDGVVIGCYKIKRKIIEIPKTPNINTIKSNVTIYDNGISYTGLDFRALTTEMIGLWLEPKTSIVDVIHGTYLKGCGYECVGISNKNGYEIMVKDNNNNAHLVSKYVFHERVPELTHGSYIFATCNLTYSKSKAHLAEEGDLFTLIELQGGGFDCKNLVNELTTNYDARYFRPAYPNEVTEYLNFFKDLEDANITTNLPMKVIKGELEIFKDEIKESTCKDLEELSDFTVEEIDNIVSDMDEQDDYKDAKGIKKIKILLANYLEKKGVVNA